MSALGQKRTCAVQNAVSALPPGDQASDARMIMADAIGQYFALTDDRSATVQEIFFGPVDSLARGFASLMRDG